MMCSVDGRMYSVSKPMSIWIWSEYASRSRWASTIKSSNQGESMEAFGYCCLDDFLKRVLRMSTELARMAVVGVRHLSTVTTCSIPRSV